MIGNLLLIDKQPQQRNKHGTNVKLVVLKREATTEKCIRAEFKLIKIIKF